MDADDFRDYMLSFLFPAISPITTQLRRYGVTVTDTLIVLPIV